MYIYILNLVIVLTDPQCDVHCHESMINGHLELQEM